MADIKLIAEARHDFGKGAARKIRRAGRIPAVVYGHGGDPVHISLEGHATMMALKHTNALLEIESTDGSRNILAIARDVQIEPVRREIEHLDLIIVKRGEKIEVEVPVHLVGEAAPGTLVSQDASTLSVLADATKLPEVIEASVEGRTVGEHVFAGQIELPEGVELITDPEALVANIAEPSREEESEDAGTGDDDADESSSEE